MLGVALIAGGLTLATVWDDEAVPTDRLRTPTKPLEIIRSGTPADRAVAVSQRLFASSPAVVVVEAKDADREHGAAITTAAELAAPVLVDGPTTSDEIERLGARTVLTFGSTRSYPGRRPVTSVSKEVARVRQAYSIERPKQRDVVVLVGSATKDVFAVATAKSAGAVVVEVPSGDPRDDPKAAKQLAAVPDAPVIALGERFDRQLTYTLAAVRSGTEQLGGGHLVFPGRAMVALYGHPSTSALGVLGEQGVARSIKRAKLLATRYRKVVKTPVVPTFEIIATVASAGAGKDQDYSRETPVRDLLPLVDAAEKHGVYVILDLQPGRTNFLTQAKRYESLLRRPHVGLALDPEWRLRPRQKHLRQIGSVSAREVNRVGDWLAALTRTHQLPQKVFVLHQFSITMIKNRSRIDTSHPELATVIHVDGQGGQADKKGTWRYLRQKAPRGVFWGWKNFVDEDKPMLSVRQTWRRVKPHPELITYQ